nr:hypothetical protein CFP56_50939 [Quercus suber]
MAGTTHKRKHAASPEDLSTRSNKQQRQLHDVRIFGKIVKSSGDAEGMKRRKMSYDGGNTARQEPPSSTMDRKRKRTRATVSSEDEGSDSESITVRPLSTPRNKRVKNAFPLSPTQTPSKTAADLFDKLKLNRAGEARAKQQDAYETPPRTPESSAQSVETALPIELQELLQIHVVFLTSLSLHFAQNGVSAGVNIAELLPNMTQAWKKRRVTLEDLRRALFVDSEKSDGFALEDCGRAGIRVVRSLATRGRLLKRTASFLDHDELNASFEDALQVRWMKWQANAEASQRDAAAFLNHLPLTEITKNASATKAAPLLARGQQHLAAIKAAQSSAQTAAAATSSPSLTADQKTTDAVHARGSTLLDRILTKQALAAAEIPVGPTRAQLERRAALQRVEDVARVLDILLAAKPRASFSLPVMVQNIQQSLRHPLAREDVERCLRLMAAEVTPGFVNVVQSGNVSAVVLCRARKVSLDEIRVRVEKFCAEL